MINEDQLEQLAIRWFQDMGWSYDRNQIIVLCYGAYLMRVGEELQPMSEGQLRKIFSEGQPDWLGGLARERVSGQDVVQLLDTQTFFGEARPQRAKFPEVCEIHSNMGLILFCRYPLKHTDERLSH